MKHTTRPSRSLAALCATGLLSCALIGAPAFATNPPSATWAPDAPAADGSASASKPASSTSSNNTATPRPSTSSSSSSSSKNTNKSTTNKTTTSKSSSASNKTATTAAKEADKKAATESKNTADQVKKTLESKGEPTTSGVVVAQGSLQGTNQGSSGSVSQNNQGKNAHQGKDATLGFGTASVAQAAPLAWGSNTPGYWWTSIWAPIVAGVTLGALIIGVGCAAIMRVRFRHQEEIMEFENGIEYTGAYVAPLVPDVIDDAESLVKEVEYTRTINPTKLTTQLPALEDTSVYLSALSSYDNSASIR